MTCSHTGQKRYDVAIIGGGIAGLTVALRLPPTLKVALLTKGKFGESNTRYAQGGLSVALGDDDSPELHFQDTLVAGAGLCDEEAVRALVEQGPEAARWLMQMGVHFDRAQADAEHATADGLLLGREGAHSRWRVLHAGGDATGAEIERALMEALYARTSIDLFEETFVSELLVSDGVCRGLYAIDREGNSLMIEAQSIVLASGGAGGLWLHTSNPRGATADGLALAWNAGAALTDLEFMQFHPTVLVANGTSHLVSEAVRGEGAQLRNHAGERFMTRYSPQAELAPRDVVARAILQEMLAEGTDHQYLDLRHLPAEKVHARFPTISAACREQGLDLARDLLPIAPAAHYCMGGVMTDTYGRTTLPGLYAVGEVACTGVHGANRLASNSLLEGLVYGLRLAAHLSQENAGTAAGLRANIDVVDYEELSPLKILPFGNAYELTTQQVKYRLREVMWQYVSLSRDQEGLREAQRRLQILRSCLSLTAPHEHQQSAVAMLEWSETLNMLQVASIVIAAALARCESRGSHWRLDYPYSVDSLAGRHYAFQRSHAHPVGLEERNEKVVSHA